MIYFLNRDIKNNLLKYNIIRDFYLGWVSDWGGG